MHACIPGVHPMRQASERSKGCSRRQLACTYDARGTAVHLSAAAAATAAAAAAGAATVLFPFSHSSLLSSEST